MVPSKPPWYKPWRRKRTNWRREPPDQLLGPGLITGAADDDPSGIATYSQAGAQFGTGLLWTMPFTYPLMSGIQEISARLGRVTGQGVAANLRDHFPSWLVYPAILLFVAANVINLGANIAAMGAAVKLLIGGPAFAYATLLVLISLGLQISFPYDAYARLLKLLTLSLLMYIGTIFVVDVDWGRVAQGLVPRLRTDAEYVAAIVAVLGTTISPYLFFWQASGEVDAARQRPHEKTLHQAPWQADKHFRRIRIDTLVGMAFSNVTAFFIILTCAVTLHDEGVTEIVSADEAAQALRPIAGDAAFFLFSLGIIGTGLLALPVLAGSAAYAIGELFQWSVGLDRTFHQARGFYVVLAAATLLGLALNLLRVNPVLALVGAAIVNGIVAPPLMAIMIWAASRPSVMGRFPISRPLQVLGWTVVAVMGFAALALLYTSLA